MTEQKRVLSGIQPSGILHLGNYFGMMKPALELQKNHECFYFIADFHALTQYPSPEDLRNRVRNVALDFLACGLDPERTVFFRQSDVPEVTELTWILSCHTPVGLMERCHSYKDKVTRGLSPNLGLFSYPVLMASDILIYGSHLVPVGPDQKQHLEITRDIASRFNHRYGEIFKIPDAIIQEDIATVPGTDGQKMSKSYDNIIEIFGPKKKMRKKIMRIVTDSTPLEEPKDPDICNVFSLYKLFASDEEVQNLRSQYKAGGMGYGTAKQALFEKYWEYFAPYRERRAELQNNPAYIEKVLQSSAQKARAIAADLLDHVKNAIGMR
ncbi:MAG: tryptophan--tRNA ligase [Lentisphaeria bacterium]